MLNNVFYLCFFFDSQWNLFQSVHSFYKFPYLGHTNLPCCVYFVKEVVITFISLFSSHFGKIYDFLHMIIVYKCGSWPFFLFILVFVITTCIINISKLYCILYFILFAYIIIIYILYILLIYYYFSGAQVFWCLIHTFKFFLSFCFLTFKFLCFTDSFLCYYSKQLI